MKTLVYLALVGVLSTNAHKLSQTASQKAHLGIKLRSKTHLGVTMLEEQEEDVDGLLDQALTGKKPSKKDAEKKSFEEEALDAKVDPSVYKPEQDDEEKPKKNKKKVVEEDDAEEEEVKPKKKKKILDSVLE